MKDIRASRAQAQQQAQQAQIDQMNSQAVKNTAQAQAVMPQE